MKSFFHRTSGGQYMSSPTSFKEEASIRVRKTKKFKPNIAEMLQASILDDSSQ